MKLNKRLTTILKMVDQDKLIVADVGADHGWLAIALVLANKASFVYACDVNVGPLNNARTNIKNYNLESKIEPVLSNGLNKLEKGSFDTVIIAGMGGSLIIEILKQDINKIKDTTLYLQPNINSYGLRKFLLNNGFTITNEQVVKDNDIIYEIIKAIPSNKKETYNELELTFGKQNLLRKDETTCELVLSNVVKINKIVEHMPINLPKRAILLAKRDLMEEYLKDIK